MNKDERNDRVSIIKALNHQIIQKTKPGYRLANYGAEDSWRGSYIGMKRTHEICVDYRSSQDNISSPDELDDTNM